MENSVLARHSIDRCINALRLASSPYARGARGRDIAHSYSSRSSSAASLDAELFLFYWRKPDYGPALLVYMPVYTRMCVSASLFSIFFLMHICASWCAIFSLRAITSSRFHAPTPIPQPLDLREPSIDIFCDLQPRLNSAKMCPSEKCKIDRKKSLPRTCRLAWLNNELTLGGSFRSPFRPATQISRIWRVKNLKNPGSKLL